MRTFIRIALRIAIPIALIGVGVGVRATLVATRPVPERAGGAARATLVEVQEVTAARHEIQVRAQGTVVPARQVTLVPQVGGRITWRSPNLVPGGRVRAGEALIRVDPRDYQVMVEQRAAELHRARLEAELERGRASVAEREWELFEGQSAPATETGRALALRQPQAENARVAVRAAESGVERARLDLRRTTITAPFDALVQDEVVDVGLVVGPTSRLATLIGTEQAWVQVSVPVDNLGRIDAPTGAQAQGAAARVFQEVGEGRIEREGHVVRLLGDLDPVGRMARILVEIPDPYALSATRTGDAGALPLLMGSYVHVEIDGRGSDEDLIEIPRTALREGQNVWVMSPQGLLEVRDVRIAWRREESVLVSSGLRSGERIVTSRIGTPIEGMSLRTADPPAQGARPERRAEAP